MEKPGEIIAGLALILLVINWLMALLVGFPILYCWGGYIAAPFYETWALLFLYIVCAFVGFYLMRRNLSGFLGGIGVFVLVIELPRLMEFILVFGGSCG